MNNSRKKVFIIIQIDGLSYRVLKKSIKNGYSPFLKSLIEKEKFSLFKINCGLPAVTSRFQLGVIYGNNKNIPGSLWFDKKKSQCISQHFPEDAKNFEDERSKGILKGGANAGSVVSGNARDNFLVVSGFKPEIHLFNYLSKNMKLFDFIFFIFMLPYVALIMFDLIFNVFSINIKSRYLSLLKKLVYNDIHRKHVIHFAKKMVKKACPYMYITFLGHDEVSHIFGCESIQSLKSIRAIDSEIKSIYTIMKKSNFIDYDLFVLSDHGHVEAIPFSEYYGETIEFVLKKITHTNVIGGREFRDAIFLKGILPVIVSYLSKFRLIRHKEKIENLMEKLGSGFFEIDQLKFSVDKEDIIVIPQGDMAQIYFNLKQEKVIHEEIEKFYPGVVDKLISIKGIRFLALSSKNGVKIIGRKGKIIINKKEEIQGTNPLEGTFDKNFLLSQIKKLVEMDNSGDIILFGSKIREKTIHFSSKYKSSHGGIERDEQEIFLLVPPRYKKPIEIIKRPNELYHFFIKYSSN